MILDGLPYGLVCGRASIFVTKPNHAVFNNSYLTNFIYTGRSNLGGKYFLIAIGMAYTPSPCDQVVWRPTPVGWQLDAFVIMFGWVWNGTEPLSFYNRTPSYPRSGSDMHFDFWSKRVFFGEGFHAEKIFLENLSCPKGRLFLEGTFFGARRGSYFQRNSSNSPWKL